MLLGCFMYQPEQQNRLLPLSCDTLCSLIPAKLKGAASANLFAAKDGLRIFLEISSQWIP